jgi:enediyne polyketide synthase
MARTARPIAVIGLAARYPGAEDARRLWENILGRRRQFRTMPDSRLPLADYHSPDPQAEDLTYGRRAAVIDGWSFDPVANRVPRSSFESTDVVHWLTLDIARQAVQHAGLQLDAMDRDRIGMVLGNTLTGEETRSNTLRLRWPFLRRALRHAASAVGLHDDDEQRLESALEHTWRSVFPKITEDSLAGGLANTIAGRVCNVLDLHGGGYVVDGACASSLLAVATAAELLETDQLDIALAGGVDMSLDPFELVGFAKATALSAGDMNVYDRRGKGFIPGEGCGVVVLQRLEDARREGRRVLAVLRGWGVSSDGRGGITAPSARGQSLALRRAYERAGYSPHELDFVEGHGTGTAVGDKVELEGIAQAIEAFGPAEGRRVGVTSFKSIVGHTKAAAGVGGFIKAVLAVNQRVVPPTAGCVEPHAVFGGAARALYPVLRADQRPVGATLRAGVSAMGFGGINSHVTLESGDAPAADLAAPLDWAFSLRNAELFPVAAASLPELVRACEALAEDAFGISEAELGDLAAHLRSSALAGPWRAAVVAGSVDELVAELRALIGRLEQAGTSSAGAGFARVGAAPRLGMLFPGQGSQVLGMAAALVDRFGWARARVGEADAAVCDLPAFSQESLSAFLLRPTWRDPADEQRAAWTAALTDTRVAQPAIALASALWLEYLARLGVEPAVVGGHSLGELTALHASGAFDLLTLVRVAALRGQAMAAPAEQPGGMAAIAASSERVTALLRGTELVVANRNAPDQTVVSGPAEQIEALLVRAAALDLQARRLGVSNAFHSPLVAGARAVLGADPQVPVAARARTCLPLSCTDGAPIAEVADLRAHLAAQITAPVDFVALAAAMAERCDLCLEVGPGRVLSGLVERCGAPVRCLSVEATVGRDREACVALAELFLAGAALRWGAVDADRPVRPFVPARERSFYRNPCERPFPDLGVIEGPSLPRSLRRAAPEQGEQRLHELLAHLRHSLRASHAAVLVVHAHGRTLLGAAPPRPEPLPVDEGGWVYRALRTGTALRTGLLVAEPGYRAEVDGWPGALLHGALAQPVDLEAESAVVWLARARDEPFSDADAATLAALAHAARPVIGAAFLEARDARARALEERTRAWAETVSREEPVRQLIRGWIEAAADSFDTEAASLFMADDGTDELYSVAACRRGANGRLEQVQVRFPATRGLAGHVFRTGHAVHLDDAYADERFNPEVDQTTGFRTRTMDCVALRAGDGRVLGVLQLLNRGAAGVSAMEGQRLERLAEQLSALIGLHRLVEGVRGAATPAPVVAIAAQRSSSDARATLYRLVSELTGFPLDTLHGELRLLDDLNLDSIKAGALLAELGGALSLPPGTMEGLAVATLDAVVERAESVVGPAVDLSARLFAMIEELTGFPSSSLHPELRLLDDLNLDSIKAGALLAELSREAGRSAAPEGLANATIAEVLAALAGSPAEAAVEAGPRWVADFVVQWRAAVAHEGAAPVGLVVVGEGALAEALGGQRVDEALTGLQAAPHELIVLMPEGPAALHADLSRLAVLARVRQRFGDGGLRRLTLVQRCDGRFGQVQVLGAHAGLRSFAGSLAQDRPDLVVRALDVHAGLSVEAAAAWVRSEHRGSASGAAGVGLDGVRVVPRLRRVDVADAVGAASLPAGGVALVTGGGKGITAECALALGQELGCTLVLVGSSAPGAEVEATVARMAAAGVAAQYRQCDVTRGEAVAALVRQVEAEVGPISVVLHGAGVNRPRPTLTVDEQAALAEIGPKLLGAEHLLAALAERPPALFVALTSVIGVLGMAGNAWYAFSNERVDLALRALAARSPGTVVRSYAYSVWDEVGMGVKLGSVDALSHRGISAIPVADGVSHFRRWLTLTPPDSQVVITGRMGALSEGVVASGRFAGEVRAHTPGVEHVTRVALHADLDRYVRDHDFRGSLLFPTVMGLEAMGQAVVAVLGREALGDVVIEQIRLDRPIVVHPTRGETIEVRAFVEERAHGEAPLVVQAAIGTASAGYGQAHFQARFVFESVSLEGPPPEVGEGLDLLPVPDLYGGLLFQGPSFQRIQQVLAVDAQHIVFRTEQRAGTTVAPEGFAEAVRLPLVVGDPYHRDTLLQAAQVVVSPSVALPVRIDRITLRAQSERAAGPGLALARYLGRDGDTLHGEVWAWDAEGRLVEQITGYQLRVLEVDPELPDVQGLLDPEARDTAVVQERLDVIAAHWALLPPRVALQHRRGLHTHPRVERRLVTTPLLELAAQRAGVSASVQWEETGRPVLAGLPELGVSLSHDDTTVLAVAGAGLQGCDLVSVVQHEPAIWRSMLARNVAVLDARAPVEGLDVAARLVWAAQEAGMKALGSDWVDLVLRESGPHGAWRLVARHGGRQVTVLAWQARLARGGDRAVAVVAHEAAVPVEAASAVPVAQERGSALEVPAGYGDLAAEGAGITADGPQGQWRFRQRGMVVFKEASEPSGSMRHSHFFRKMGELRELAARPVMEAWVQDFLTGRWGAVTNHTRLVVHGAVAAGEVIEGSVWSAGLSGPLGSTMELRFGWEAVAHDGARRTIASGAMATTWVEVTGHGEARLAPNPPYLTAFAERIGPKQGPVPGLPAPALERGAPVYRPGLRPGQPPRHRASFQTSREHGNIVGNIYFAHYPCWQGEAVDGLLARSYPAYASGRVGELRVQHVAMEHFREAMPYDAVEVHLHVVGLWERGISLRSEVFRHVDGGLLKLAAGEIEGVWYAPSGDGWAPAALPAALVEALRREA